MLPLTAGARPGKMNMMSRPNSARLRLFPERKPSPTPTSSNKDPTPQAIPNMVRNERSLCAHRLRKICPKMSNTVRMGELLDTFHVRRTFVLQGQQFPLKRIGFCEGYGSGERRVPTAHYKIFMANKKRIC